MPKIVTIVPALSYGSAPIMIANHRTSRGCRAFSVKSLLRYAGVRMGLAGFEQRLEARQDLRPAAGNRLDELGSIFLDRVGDAELCQFLLFGQLDDTTRPAFGLQLGAELVLPLDDDPGWRIAFQNLPAVGNRAVGL